jgi:hypothetical protein
MHKKLNNSYDTKYYRHLNGSLWLGEEEEFEECKRKESHSMGIHVATKLRKNFWLYCGPLV